MFYAQYIVYHVIITQQITSDNTLPFTGLMYFTSNLSVLSVLEITWQVASWRGLILRGISNLREKKKGLHYIQLEFLVINTIRNITVSQTQYPCPACIRCLCSIRPASNAPSDLLQMISWLSNSANGQSCWTANTKLVEFQKVGKLWHKAH